MKNITVENEPSPITLIKSKFSFDFLTVSVLLSLSLEKHQFFNEKFNKKF